MRGSEDALATGIRRKLDRCHDYRVWAVGQGVCRLLVEHYRQRAVRMPVYVWAEEWTCHYFGRRRAAAKIQISVGGLPRVSE